MSMAIALLWVEVERALERWRELRRRKGELQQKVTEETKRDSREPLMDN